MDDHLLHHLLHHLSSYIYINISNNDYIFQKKEFKGIVDTNDDFRVLNIINLVCFEFVCDRIFKIQTKYIYDPLCAENDVYTPKLEYNICENLINFDISKKIYRRNFFFQKLKFGNQKVVFYNLMSKKHVFGWENRGTFP